MTKTAAASSKRYSGPGPWIDDPFAQLIREWREQSGQTQTQMARSLGIEQSEISLWERGWVQAPRYGRMQAVATLIQIPLDELLARTRWTGPYREKSDQRELAGLRAVSNDPIVDLIEETKHLSSDQLVTLVRIARVLSDR